MISEAKMGSLCCLDCFLPSLNTDIFGDPSELVCWPYPGKARYFRCSVSVGPLGIRVMQEALEAVCEAERLGASCI